jgi:enoyl-CoA hydratase/carnithine racemase
MAAMATGEADPEAGTGFQVLLDLLLRFDKPLLAAVNGVGMGLGCTILGHVDLVLMDVGARLRAPFAEMGVPPEAGSSVLLPSRMGWQQAAAALLASEWISAETAVTSGLALRACPDGTVLAETLELARTIASFPPHATRQIKRLMLAGRGSAVADARRREEVAFAALFADPSVNPGARLADGLGA